MYRRRFKNRHGTRILHLQGRFALTHVGGGTFIYSFPGRRHPIVGKIELGRKKYRQRALGSVMVVLGGLTVMSLLSGSSSADPITGLDDLKDLEAQGKLEELEEQSEEIKSRLYDFSGETESRDGSGEVRILEYTVREGDTLSTIALRQRVPMGIIAESSKIKVHSVLRPGQTLMIPDRPGLLYKMKSGDTLAAVAEHYSVKIESIVRENQSLANLDMIEPGTQVFLPNAVVPIPPPTWLRPLAGGRITSWYGWRRHPLRNYRHLHAGIDIACRYASVRAVRDGEVIFAGWLGSYGNAVVIRHPGGFKSLYAHLSRIGVRKGQIVKAGHRVAVSGNTGLSTGPHLHFELIYNGKPINPRRYIRF